MFDGYYLVIIILVIAKILFWSCYCYARNKRLNAATRSTIVVVTHEGPRTTSRNITTNDRLPIVHSDEIAHQTNQYPSNNSAQFAAPPKYEEVMRNKPPSYEQVIAGQAMTNKGFVGENPSDPTQKT